MGGLSGWIGNSATVNENRQLIEEMVKPITRFDSSSVQSADRENAALALAANGAAAHFYQQGDLIVALWGDVKYRDVVSGKFVTTDNLAKRLAEDYQQNGEKIFAGLVGEFLFCMLDEQSGEAVLVVDRMATRSFSFQVSGETLIFSSSTDAIIQHPLVKKEIDRQSLYDYVYFHMVLSPGSIYKEQQRLLPGQILIFQRGEIKINRYWEASFAQINKASFSVLKQEFLEILRVSVRDVVGNQEVDAFLSGGTDSSTIAGILGEVTGKPARTYSIGFDAAGYDEMECARITAKHFSMQHHEYYVTTG